MAMTPSTKVSLQDFSAGPAPADALAPVKPRLRGVLHQVSFFVALVSIAAHWLRTRSSAGGWAVRGYGATLVNRFGTSACYHRIDWRPVARARMRRLDHAAIFLLIGGGYTPLFALVNPEGAGHGALVAIWIGVAVGVVKSLAWPHAPKWLTALLCVGLGWMVIFQVVHRAPLIGPASVAMLVAGGVTYSLGALVYALKRPNPWPRVFGYHEVFHALVCLASGFVFAHVALVVRAVSG